ncbi:MAG: DsrE family protein [Chitinophagaceae bacterium]
MKPVFFIAFLLFLLPASMMGQGQRHRIVFQFTNAQDTLQQKAFIKQLQNLKAHWPDATFEVVLYNQGLELLLPNKGIQISAVKALHDEGIDFLICENTLKNRQMSKEQFPAWVNYIPAGIAHMVERQEEGWSYIKGGF